MNSDAKLFFLIIELRFGHLEFATYPVKFSFLMSTTLHRKTTSILQYLILDSQSSRTTPIQLLS